MRGGYLLVYVVLLFCDLVLLVGSKKIEEWKVEKNQVRITQEELFLFVVLGG